MWKDIKKDLEKTIEDKLLKQMKIKHLVLNLSFYSEKDLIRYKYRKGNQQGFVTKVKRLSNDEDRILEDLRDSSVYKKWMNLVKEKAYYKYNFYEKCLENNKNYAIIENDTYRQELENKMIVYNANDLINSMINEDNSFSLDTKILLTDNPVREYLLDLKLVDEYLIDYAINKSILSLNTFVENKNYNDDFEFMLKLEDWTIDNICWEKNGYGVEMSKNIFGFLNQFINTDKIKEQQNLTAINLFVEYFNELNNIEKKDYLHELSFMSKEMINQYFDTVYENLNDNSKFVIFEIMNLENKFKMYGDNIIKIKYVEDTIVLEEEKIAGFVEDKLIPLVREFNNNTTNNSILINDLLKDYEWDKKSFIIEKIENFNILEMSNELKKQREVEDILSVQEEKSFNFKISKIEKILRPIEEVVFRDNVKGDNFDLYIPPKKRLEGDAKIIFKNKNLNQENVINILTNFTNMYFKDCNVIEIFERSIREEELKILTSNKSSSAPVRIKNKL